MMDEESFRRQLGEKVRKRRVARGMTAPALAAAAGLDEDLIARCEEGLSLPALGELMNLANALDVSMGWFFMPELTDARVEVVRAGERWRVTPKSNAAATLNYSYESLAYRMTQKMMSPFHIEIPPSADREPAPLSHEGEEFLYVLSGEVDMRVGEERYTLGPGDAIYFDSRQEHTVRAAGSQPARLLACLVNVRHATGGAGAMERAY